MSAQPQPGEYNLDPSHTHVGFAVKHFGLSKVRGQFEEFSGVVTVGENPLESSVSATIQTESFNSRDNDRDTHIKSGDFLEVDKFPTMTFQSTGLKQDGDDEYILTGDLTIKDVTRPVELEVEFEGAIVDPYGLDRIAFNAETEIDRTEWGLDFMAALETGGLIVGKKVKITLEVEAVKPADVPAEA